MKWVGKIQYNSPVILSFALVSFLVLLLAMVLGEGAVRPFFVIYRSGFSPLFVVRLFGHVLGHASIEHYVGNIMLILLIGPILEEKYGSTKMLCLILITALITGLFHLILSPNATLRGASGIVFMLILLSSYVNLQKGKIPLTLILILVIYLGQEVAAMVMIQDNISRLAHIVGGLCGAGMGYVMNQKSL